MCYSILFVFLTDAKSIVPAEVSKDEISPYWSFNETADISKYEDFDHKKFLGKYNFIIIKYTYLVPILNYKIFLSGFINLLNIKLIIKP